MSMYPPQDEYNPYASPKAELRGSQAEYDLPPVNFDIGEILSRTWMIYRARLGLCIGVVMGCFVINLGFALLNQGVNSIVLAAIQDSGPVSALATLGVSLVFVVLQNWINVGQSLVMLKVARGEPTSFGEVFSGGRFVLRIILASLIVGLALGGAAVVFFLVGGLLTAAVGRDSGLTIVVMGLGILLGILAAVLVSVRISQFLFVIIERETGAMDSLKVSANLTSGKLLPLIALFLIVGLINLGGLLALVVGLIFTIPFGSLLLAVTYCALAPKSTFGKQALSGFGPANDPYY